MDKNKEEKSDKSMDEGTSNNGLPQSLPSNASQPMLLRHRPHLNLELPRRGSETALLSSLSSLRGSTPSKPAPSSKSSEEGLSYSAYLHLNSILNAQHPQSELNGEAVHDEHLFIVVHQTYELWFKQVLFEVDSVRAIFEASDVDEPRMLSIVKRVSRINLILKLLVEQFQVLETMSALDFLSFRSVLSTASGFQSLQFRLLENKLGLQSWQRVKYNQDNYMRVFGQDLDALRQLHQSENENSLSQCVQKWLEKVGFSGEFRGKFELAVAKVLEVEMAEAEKEQDEVRRVQMINNVKIRRDQFESIFDEERHEALRQRGERKFSRDALLGAIRINLYKDQPQFHQAWLLLEELMNLDALLTRWRWNHVLLVQRMIGSQQLGSGGSSGYLYLRSTISDRYKVFIDIFNCSTFLIPRQYVPDIDNEDKDKKEETR